MRPPPAQAGTHVCHVSLGSHPANRPGNRQMMSKDSVEQRSAANLQVTPDDSVPTWSCSSRYVIVVTFVGLRQGIEWRCDGRLGRSPKNGATGVTGTIGPLAARLSGRGSACHSERR